MNCRRMLLGIAGLALPLFFGPGCLPVAGAEQKSPSAGASEAPAARVLVVYHSRSGNTERLARAVVDGIQRVPGAAATLRRVEQVTKEELQAADAIALGCPTYFANIPGTMKTALDDWNWKWKVDFTDKLGGAFATGGGQTGGKEQVVVSLLLFMLSNRMLVAGPLYEDEEGDDKWGEIGVTAMTGPLDPGVGPKELEQARRLGDRLARLAVGRRRP